MISKRVKTTITSLMLGLLLLALPIVSGCSKSAAGTATGTTASNPAVTASNISVVFDSDDLTSNWDSAAAAQIAFQGSSATVKGDGAVVNGNVITIKSGGDYVVSGKISDGQIIIDTSDSKTVQLVLNGIDLTSLTSAPIYVKNAAKTVVTLAAGTSNTITDGNSYVLAGNSDEPNAAIFSHDDLTINGTGSLTVNGNYQHGINCKDDLKIVSGNITVNSVQDGIRGRNCIAVKAGSIVVDADSDGLQSNNDEDAGRGFIYIESGQLEITAGNDGLQAATEVVVKDGQLSITAGGGSSNGISHSNQSMPGQAQTTASTTTAESAKGIKAGTGISIAQGVVDIDSADDAIHSNGSIIISGGTINLDSGDDGVHADTALEVNGGTITIAKSYEGLESASIAINGGDISVTASDDGINTAGGSDGSSVNGRPGQNNFDASDGSQLSISGGYIYVNARGDGIDVNGDWVMTGGTVLVDGPTDNGNGALDYNGSFSLNGGWLAAAGSSGMAQAPGSTSSQASLKLNLGSQAAGTLVNIVDSQGQNILTFAPAKAYASVVVSSPQIKSGSVYTVYTGGSCSGTQKNGLYSGGSYTPGTQVASLTASGTVTEYGQSGGGMTGRPGGRPPGKTN